MARVIAYIENLEGVKAKIKEADIPETFTLRKAEVITNVEKFIDSHLTRISIKELTRIHKPYFNRLDKVLKSLGIVMIVKRKKIKPF